MPAMALSAWARAWSSPDPRSPQRRIYSLACLVAIAICAFTAAGNDRFTAVGQWIRRASQQDLARLRAPWDPMATARATSWSRARGPRRSSDTCATAGAFAR